MKVAILKPNPNNPRLVKDDSFLKLVKSIQEFPKMFPLRPIVVDENFMVIGGNIQVGGSLTFTDEAMSKKWEQNSSSPQERFDTLRILHEEGVRTWASMEPVIYPDQSLEIMHITHEYVDAYKIGKLNHFPKHEVKFDWTKFLSDAVGVMRGYDKTFYIKEDLRKHKAEDLLLSKQETDMDFMALKNAFSNELQFA